jgi:hypothetical protein
VVVAQDSWVMVQAHLVTQAEMVDLAVAAVALEILLAQAGQVASCFITKEK